MPKRRKTSSRSTCRDLPVHADDLAEFEGDRAACIKAMIEKVVDRMYAEIDDNRFLEVTYANGDKEVMYFKDFNSGRDDPERRRPGEEERDQVGARNRSARVCASSTCSTRSSTSSPRTRTCPTPPILMTGPRISGKKGERIVYIRTLVTGKSSSAVAGHRHRVQPGPVPVREFRCARTKPRTRNAESRCRGLSVGVSIELGAGVRPLRSIGHQRIAIGQVVLGHLGGPRRGVHPKLGMSTRGGSSIRRGVRAGRPARAGRRATGRGRRPGSRSASPSGARGVLEFVDLLAGVEDEHGVAGHFVGAGTAPGPSTTTVRWPAGSSRCRRTFWLSAGPAAPSRWCSSASSADR